MASDRPASAFASARSPDKAPDRHRDPLSRLVLDVFAILFEIALRVVALAAVALGRSASGIGGAVGALLVTFAAIVVVRGPITMLGDVRSARHRSVGQAGGEATRSPAAAVVAAPALPPAGVPAGPRRARAGPVAISAHARGARSSGGPTPFASSGTTRPRGGGVDRRAAGGRDLTSGPPRLGRGPRPS